MLTAALPDQLAQFPTTRFMGSKRKLLPELFDVAQALNFRTAIDVFSGSGVVAYLFKAMGKTVLANDYMHMCWQFSRAMIENNETTVTDAQLERLLGSRDSGDGFVLATFRDLYFSDEDSIAIDRLRCAIKRMRNPHARAIATTALIRACMKRRPRGIFTYTGHRYDDGRKDLKKDIPQHFREAVALVNAAVFDNGLSNRARLGDALTLRQRQDALAYLDPPYFTPKSDNEYVRRYHFVEGLARDWKGVEIQQHTVTKKFRGYPTPFSTHQGALAAFRRLFWRFRDSIIVVSYSSNALPTMDELIELLSDVKDRVEVVPVEYRYSFGNQGHRVGDNRNSVKEYLFVGS